MSYTPKHAKPASAKDVALNTYRGAFGTSDATAGRHARQGNESPQCMARAGAGTGQSRDSQRSRVA
jgi:hypothetical protein